LVDEVRDKLDQASSDDLISSLVGAAEGENHLRREGGREGGRGELVVMALPRRLCAAEGENHRRREGGREGGREE